MSSKIRDLKLLSASEYAGVNRDDPIRFYHWPVLGRLYRRRVETALAECTGGDRVLEIGFGSGVTFLNLADMYAEIYGLDLTSQVDLVRSVFRSHGIEAKLLNGSVLEMPYPDGQFDTVLLISILEHLKPAEQLRAFQEISRVLRNGGQVVYGVPVERPLMALMFRVLGYNIKKHHFSSEKDVAEAAEALFHRVRITEMQASPGFLGSVYQVGHFVKV